MLAQGLVEYSALTAMADGVQHASVQVQDWIASVDSRVFWIGGVILAVWVGRRLLSH